MWEYLITNEVFNCKLPQCPFFHFCLAHYFPQNAFTWADQERRGKHHNQNAPRLCNSLVAYLAGSSQSAVGSIWALLIGQPPATEAVHRVGGDGVAELLEWVVPIPALFDLMKQFGQFACHSIIWGGCKKCDPYLWSQLFSYRVRQQIYFITKTTKKKRWKKIFYMPVWFIVRLTCLADTKPLPRLLPALLLCRIKAHCANHFLLLPSTTL